MRYHPLTLEYQVRHFQKCLEVASPDYYDLKKQEQILPEIVPKPKSTEDTGILIVPETLVILAPKSLQNIINIEVYKEN